MFSGSDYGPGLETAPSFPECNEHCIIRSSLNPAHETYDDDLGKVLDTKCYNSLRRGLEKFPLGQGAPACIIGGSVWPCRLLYLVPITLNLGLISTTGMYHYNKTSTILTTSRVIYAINGETDQLEVRFL